MIADRMHNVCGLHFLGLIGLDLGYFLSEPENLWLYSR
jgi:hypothetical protein